MLRLLADENLDHRILRGLRLRVPDLDLVLVQETELKSQDDPIVLAWAAVEGRVLVTHDLKTIPKFAYQRVEGKQPMPGIIAVPDALPIRQVIDELELLIELCDPPELENLVIFLPV